MTGAAAGTLSFLVGGPKDILRLAEAYLSCMGKRIIHCGDSGAGLAAKICNNALLGVQQVATAEAMLLGKNLGLDPGPSGPRLELDTQTECPVISGACSRDQQVTPRCSTPAVDR